VQRRRLAVTGRLPQQAVDGAPELDPGGLIEDELEGRSHDVALVFAGDRLERRVRIDHAPIGVQYDRQFTLCSARARARASAARPGGARPVRSRIDDRYRREVVLVESKQRTTKRAFSRVPLRSGSRASNS